MSSISKMQIRGIRSFSPDHDEMIEFYSPLTMIVGANGCGKTTIIESLKFATTGSLPPNTRGGSSLVNDPGLTDTTEVKAGIKLRFQNRSNRVCVAVRSLQVTRKRTKLEYKALEGVLRTTDENNETVSISMKCSDMDRLIPENLGVSPAILENVIFVHQEDSNWPMQEGMVLKKKFDDVFESTRYTKALEALLKSRKEIASKARDLKGELAEFGAHLMTATQTRRELETCQENQEICRKAIQVLTEKQNMIDGKLQEASRKLSDCKASAQEVEKLQIQVTQQEQFIKERTKALEAPLTESDETLQQMLSNFEGVMKTKQSQLKEIKQQIDEITSEISQLRSISNDLNMKQGQAMTLQEQLQSLQQQQVVSIQSLRQKYPRMPNPSSQQKWTVAMTKECIAILQQEYTQLSQEKEQQLSSLRMIVESTEREMKAMNHRISTIETELRLKTEEMHSLTQESESKRLEMNKLSTSRSQVQRCEMEYQSALRTYEEFMESYQAKTADYKKQIKDVSDEIRDLQERISQETQLLQDLSHHRNELAALDGNLKQIEGDLTSLQLELQSIFSITNRDLLQVISTKTPQSYQELETFYQQFEQYYQQHTTQALQQERETNNRYKSEIAAIDALLQQQQQVFQTKQEQYAQYKAFEKEMKTYITTLNTLRTNKILIESEFEEIAPTVSIEDLLIAAKVTEDEARELSVIAKSGKVFLKHLKKARKQNPQQCPCCGQGMTNPTIQTEFDQRIKQLFPFADEESQGTVEEHKEVLSEATTVHESIFLLYQQMLPLLHQYQEMKSIEQLMKQYQQDKISKQQLLQQQEFTLQQLEQQSYQVQKVSRQLSEVTNRWKSLESKQQELMERKQRRQMESAAFLNYGGTASANTLVTLSIEEIESQHHQHVELKDTLQLKKEKLNQEESNYQRKYFTTKTMLSEKEKSLSDAKLENNRITELEQQIQQVEKKLEEIDYRKRTLQQEKKTVTTEQQEISSRYQREKGDYDQKEQDWQQQLSTLLKAKENLITTYSQYEEMQRKYQEIALPKILQKLQETQESIQQSEIKIQQELEPIYTTYQQELSSQERTKRNIINNLELRQQQRDLQRLQLTCQEKVALYGGNAYLQEMRTYERDFQTLTKEREQTLGEGQHTRGQLETLEKHAKELQMKLNSVTYRGIEEKHRKKLIELETTNLAVSDLDNYYTALDRALQDFHTLKIKEINKIIRELWQLIYQGQDIDTIEIQSGSDLTDADGFAVPVSTAGANGSGSRSYNYRVVMKKGDIPLDMRGRCSAGQKVLAAIVIRLALAETFCLNCGILALDEPTTNLDEANKHGLAAALARLILARAKQQNFQLICITHDEEFVQLIRTELSFSNDFNLPEYYFRVYRSEEGNSGRFFSHIERIPWEDM